MKVQDENSISRQQRAAQLPKQSKDDILALLGDTEDAKYPIYMTGTLEDNTNTFLFVITQLHHVTLFFRSNTSHSLYGST